MFLALIACTLVLTNLPDASGPSLFPSPEDERRQKRERLSAALDNLRDRGMM